MSRQVKPIPKVKVQDVVFCTLRKAKNGDDELKMLSNQWVKSKTGDYPVLVVTQKVQLRKVSLCGGAVIDLSDIKYGDVIASAEMSEYSMYTQLSNPVMLIRKDGSKLEDIPIAGASIHEAYDDYLSQNTLDTDDENAPPMPNKSNTYYAKLIKNSEVPTIEKNDFYVDKEVWYYLVRNIRKHKPVLITGPSGTGKCHTKGTKVLMYNGSVKNVEDVVVGDLLMGDDSTPRKVLTLARGKDWLYDIIPTRGEEFGCNESHILSLKKRSRKKLRETVGGKRIYKGIGNRSENDIINISVKDYLNTSQNFKNNHLLYRVPVEYPHRKVNIDPYFIGLWIGDGRWDAPTICTEDKVIIDYLTKFSQSIGMRLSKYPEPSNADSYGIVSRPGLMTRPSKLGKRMIDHGLLKDSIKFIPEIFKINSREVRLQLLAGLIDSDGHLTCGCYEFTTKYKRLEVDVVALCQSLGYYVSVSIKLVEGSPYYRLHISGNISEVPVKLKRKKASKRKQIKDVLVTSFLTVKRPRKGDYYGFTLDGNHLYLLKDCTVTHNTELIQIACKQLGLNLYVIDMSGMTDPVAGLIGVHRLGNSDVGSYFDFSRFSEAIQDEKGVVLLDELNRAALESANILLPVTDDRRQLYCDVASKNVNRIIEVKASIVATANIGFEYVGVNSIDRALLDRFNQIELNILSNEHETILLQKRRGISEFNAKIIVKVVQDIRTLYEKQEITTFISTRYTLEVASLVSDGWDLIDAFSLIIYPLFSGTLTESGERNTVHLIVKKYLA